MPAPSPGGRPAFMLLELLEPAPVEPARPHVVAPAPQPAAVPSPQVEPVQPASAPEAAPLPSDPAPVTRADVAVDAHALDADTRRRAAIADRQLRGSGPLVPAQRPNTPFNRMEKAMSGAFNDRSYALYGESYESPDGVVTYRFTQRGMTRCAREGKPVSCPGGDIHWTRR